MSFRAYTPVWLGDEWQILVDFALAGHYPLSKLWEQHNEHRVPVVKALELLELYFFHGDHRLLLFLNWVVQGLQFAVMAWLLNIAAPLTRAEWLTALGIVAFCVFHPLQAQNFDWAFQFTFLASFLFAQCALAGLAYYSFCRQTRWLAASILCAALAQLHLAAGLLTWVVLPWEALYLGLSRRVAFVLVASGVFASSLFFVGYRSLGTGAQLLSTFRHPLPAMSFVAATFAHSWPSLSLGSLATYIGLGTVLVGSVLAFRCRLQPLEIYALSLALLISLVALATAIARARYGVGQALESRYQTPAMLFWAALAIGLFASLDRLEHFRSAALSALQILFVLVAATQATSFPGIMRHEVEGAHLLNRAGLAYEAGIHDEAALLNIYPVPALLFRAYGFARERDYMDPPFPELAQVGKLLRSEYRILRAEECEGAVESVRRIGASTLAITGWGYDRVARSAFPRVLAVAPYGQIVGLGVSGAYRAQPSLSYSGWDLYASPGANSTVLAIYGANPASREACFLAPLFLS